MMKHSIAMQVLAAVAMFCAASPTLAVAQSPANDLKTIMTWWNGDYDNDAQIAALKKDGKPVWRKDVDKEIGGHADIVSHYRPIQLPAFGAHVIYVEETKFGDPTNIFRQRIYTLSIDEASTQLRVKLWSFKDKTKYVGAWKDLGRLAAVTPAEMSPLPDKCDLRVTREGAKFHMAMHEKDCAFGENYFNYQVLLGENSFWFRDKISKVADDTIVSSAGNFTYHELVRQ
jgi:hypothetical protein